MSQRTSSISRYYPQLLLIAGVVVALSALHLHNIYNSQPKKKPKTLRRRNAQRARNRTRSIENADAQQAATAEALSRLDGTTLMDADHARMLDSLSAEGLTLPTDDTFTTMMNNAGAVARGNREDGNDSDFSYDPDSKEGQENQNVLHLLYLIAEDQAKQQGYVHRGVTCNLCNVIPIRGVRYRCANCVDFDLCESCEAQDVHPKTHLFYKVRIPAPFLGNPRKTQAPVYPGKPSIMSSGIPPETLKKFGKDTGMEQAEIDALYEQFKCLAATEFPEDPNGLGGGINRTTFDKCFVPNNSLRPPPPNLIYDRMFAYYDSDGNGLIGFEEFIRGLSIRNKRTASTTANIAERHKRVFKAYDLDGDGFIERKDVLRMFRAYYALQKDLVKDLIAGMDDDVLESTQSHNVINGSQPISAAFSTAIPVSDDMRRIKTLHEEMNDIDRDALRVDGNEQGRRRETIANALQQHRREVSRERASRRSARAEERLRRTQAAPTATGTRLREELDDEDDETRQEVAAELDNEHLRDDVDDVIIDAILEAGGIIDAQHAQEVPDLEQPANAIDDLISSLNDADESTEAGDAEDIEQEVPEENLVDVEEQEDYIPDTFEEGSRQPVNQDIEVTIITPPVAPQLPELDIEPFPPFDLPDDWTADMNLKDTIRRPSEEELKLFYLEDYYKSEEEETEDEYANEGWILRKRPPVTRGLEKEEDVGREILCQVVEQGINEMLDLLFLPKEKDGIEVLHDEHDKPEKPAPSSGENKENIEATDAVGKVEMERRINKLFEKFDESDWKESSSEGNSPTASDPKLSPPRDPLARLKKEVAKRGGPGRISEQEFVGIMQGDTGRKLAFMSTWINMGSF